MKLARRLRVTTWVMAVIFPVWGASAAIVLGFDRFLLLRRNRRLRAAFGQR